MARGSLRPTGWRDPRPHRLPANSPPDRDDFVIYPAAEAVGRRFRGASDAPVAACRKPPLSLQASVLISDAVRVIHGGRPRTDRFLLHRPTQV